jgi:probable addiction module antidote protein
MRVEETDVYRDWIDALEDRAGRARILVRVDRLIVGWELPGVKRMPKASSRKGLRTRTTPYDVAAHLRTPEEMAAYLDAWLDEAPDDAAGIARALGDIARAKGMSQVAKDAGLSRESLYRALSGEGNPSFATVLKVAKALGVRLHAEPA